MNPDSSKTKDRKEYRLLKKTGKLVDDPLVARTAIGDIRSLGGDAFLEIQGKKYYVYYRFPR
jgi:hypothetical protein